MLLFMFFFLAVLGLRCCVGFSLAVAREGVQASHCVDYTARALGPHGFSSCGPGSR